MVNAVSSAICGDAHRAASRAHANCAHQATRVMAAATKNPGNGACVVDWDLDIRGILTDGLRPPLLARKRRRTLPRMPAAPSPDARRFVAPTIGIAMGAGLIVAESVLLVRDFLGSFGAGGVWKELLGCLVGYALAGAALDLLVQAIAPARWRHSWLARGIPVVVLAFALQWSFGIVSMLAVATVPLAVGWTLAAHVRWGLPMSVGLALLALSPALPHSEAHAGSAVAAKESTWVP